MELAVAFQNALRGAQRYRVNDGLPQGRPEQRLAGADQQGQPRGGISEVNRALTAL
jgi:hypothetical protein